MSISVETKIKIKFNKNKEITLSKDEAEILFNELKTLFDKQKEYIPWYPYYPLTVPCKPYITYGDNIVSTVSSSKLDLTKAENYQKTYTIDCNVN